MAGGHFRKFFEVCLAFANVISLMKTKQNKDGCVLDEGTKREKDAQHNKYADGNDCSRVRDDDGNNDDEDCDDQDDEDEYDEAENDEDENDEDEYDEDEDNFSQWMMMRSTITRTTMMTRKKTAQKSGQSVKSLVWRLLLCGILI